MRRVLLALVLAASLGCAAKKPAQPVVGSANQFDSTTYLSLVTADSVIQTTKADLAASKFPTSIAGKVKDALNGLIEAYDAANVTYIAYHTSAMSGTDDPQKQAEVRAKMAAVQSASVNLTNTKEGK